MLTPKQELAIAALLQERSIADAARACGLDERTLRRWLADPAFAAAYRLARRQVVEAAIGRLQQAAGQAVEVLQASLQAVKPGDRIRAALGILDRAVAGVELADLATKVEELEQLMRELRDESSEPHSQAAGRGPRDGRPKTPDGPPPILPGGGLD